MALATVTATWGSAPRPRGSHLLIREDGAFEGSVSGGCVEGEVIHAGAETIADGLPRRLRFGVANASAWEVGLPCGGDIEILVQPVTQAGFDEPLFELIEQARMRGETFSIATDLASGRSAPGTDSEFVNRYAPPWRLLIVGAVQIAQSLTTIASTLDVTSVVIDPRERFLTEARFPGITRDNRWPDEAIAGLAPDASTAIVTLSHDIKIDDPALIAALATPARYVAALGSRRSHAARLDRLRAAGLTDADLARIDAPAGLPIGAIGPAEIALSIAAGMIAAFRA
jgi:xanthine dehydrogenase accessory factor